MTDETSAHVAETGASRFAVRIDVGGHAIIGDEPAATGGADLGPSPFQLLAAALGTLTLAAGTAAVAADRLIIAATPVPHAEILEFVKPMLAKESDKRLPWNGAGDF